MFKKEQNGAEHLSDQRELWLILVEMTIINFAFSIDIHFSVIALTTVWSTGISMALL